MASATTGLLTHPAGRTRRLVPLSFNRYILVGVISKELQSGNGCYAFNARFREIARIFGSCLTRVNSNIETLSAKQAAIDRQGARSQKCESYTLRRQEDGALRVRSACENDPYLTQRYSRAGSRLIRIETYCRPDLCRRRPHAGGLLQRLPVPATRRCIRIRRLKVGCSKSMDAFVIDPPKSAFANR